MGGLGNLRSAMAMKTNLALLLVVLVQKTFGHGIMLEPFTWQDFKGEGLDVKKPQELGCGSLSEDFNLGLPHGRPGCGIHFFEENLKVNRITVPKESMVRPIKSTKSPWMAPGSIDIDACGIYGGGRFANMTTATAEMPFPKAEYEPTVWMPGQKVEVTWFVAANHVGGYQFRLCKLKNNLSRKDVSEECFRQEPLPFATRETSVLNIANWWNRGNESLWDLVTLPETYEGTTPEGSVWRKTMYNADFGKTKDKNEWAMKDILQVPSHLTPGQYVLGFRWDCEKTTQVWSSCADITVVAPY